MNIALARMYLEFREEQLTGKTMPTECPPQVRAFCSGKDDPELCKQCLAMH